MLKIPVLGINAPDFPPIHHALDEPNGLLAAGGDLYPATLIKAYSKGIFPWFDDDQPILWWSPSPRAVLLPDQLHISRSLHKALKRSDYQVSMDTAFDAVIEGCSQPRNYTNATWITEEMKMAYGELHKLGIAHSIETWRDNELIGGLYGIALGKIFFGESMFSRATDASKIAFVHLVQQLNQWGFKMIDCQVSSPHVMSLGAVEVAREIFQSYLIKYIPQLDQILLPGSNMPGDKWQLEWRYLS